MAADNRTLLITCHHLLREIDKYRAEIAEKGVELVLAQPKGQQFSEAEMSALFKECNVAICGDDPMPRSVLEHGAQNELKTIIRWGIGTDSVDADAAAELGIRVLNTPGQFGHEVADAAFSLILMLARGYHRMDRSIREGGWSKVVGRSLNGLTLGVVGLGSIGRQIVTRGHAFGMQTIGCDAILVPEKELQKTGTKQLEFRQVVDQADVLVLACNLTSENRHMMNAETLFAMKEGSYLINVARGPLVDSTALYRALTKGPVSGAGLDVFEVEPLPLDDPLRELDQCVFGTHNGSNTAEAVDRVNRKTVSMALSEMAM